MVFQGREELAKKIPEIAVAGENANFPAGHPLLVALRDLK
jgi:hypothetical protein